MIGINLFCGGMLGIFFLNYLSQGRVYRLLEFNSEKIVEGHQYYRLVTFFFVARWIGPSNWQSFSYLEYSLAFFST